MSRYVREVRSAGLLVFILSVSAFVSCASTPQQYTSNIVNGTVTVTPSAYVFYQAVVTSTMTSPRLSGTFTASGGSGNDIRVYVLDQTNYTNWANGHNASALYNSGQVTTGSFDVALPSSVTYYVVYDNTFSTFSTKNVSTHVDLTYEM